MTEKVQSNTISTKRREEPRHARHHEERPVPQAILREPLRPLRFQPLYKSVIWGGECIAAYKGETIEQPCVGESWEISAIPGHETTVIEGPYAGLKLSELVNLLGERLLGRRVFSLYGADFPLLIKFIDAKHDLSLQVHPGELIARRRHGCAGKTEMWYIIATHPGAKILSGFSRAITSQEYRAKVADGTILDSVAEHTTAPGDVFYIPSGRVHAIGAGNLLLEVQQSSDITYRIYDYNRLDKNGKPRELHTEIAAEAIDYRLRDDYRETPRQVAKGEEVLVQCPVFEVRKLTVEGHIDLRPPRESFLTMTCVEGTVEVRTPVSFDHISRGQTLLIPGEIRSDITLEGNGKLITACC
ncbi:MAG: class I mannose-6-phosphate isomerase [Bacteroidales bacterium]|nr:class I mannose-6-phosphate isomerase [Bacteroidales bacterium]MCD8393778.1 class I mannose-6-phosphate isomerase [Bacteroidales bacterium]